jgi:hypothetical protein
MVIVLAVLSKIHGFKPGRGRCIYRAMKISSTIFLKSEVKLKIRIGYERDTCRQNSAAISRPTAPASLLGFPACYCQRAVVDESEITRTQMGKHNR